MAASNILQEYLIALGFSIDKQSASQADKMMKTVDKTLATIAKTAVAATGAIGGVIETFASNMEKLYYASQRSGSTVQNLQAMASGAERIGIGGDRMVAAIEGMSRAMRLNPGLRGLVESLGVKVEGRDPSDVMVDLVGQLKQMPFYVGSQFAGLFGIDPDTLLQLEQGVDKLKQAADVRRSLSKELGVDTEKAALAAVEYKNQWRDITDRVGLLRDAIALSLLPAVREFGGVVKLVLDDWIKIVNRTQGMGDFFTKLAEGLGLKKPQQGVQFSAQAQWRAQAGEANGVSNAPDSGGVFGTGAYFSMLEKKYGLPAGLLDSMWQQESGRGKNMLSGKGAKGHFQFMDATAKEYGVSDPNNLQQSADGAARMMSRMLGQYGGNLDMALAAYNWGSGNLGKYTLGSAPKETRDYITQIEGRIPGYTQNTTINVMGSADPVATAHAVAGEQKRVASDIVRNQLPRSR